MYHVMSLHTVGIVLAVFFLPLPTRLLSILDREGHSRPSGQLQCVARQPKPSADS